MVLKAKPPEDFIVSNVSPHPLHFLQGNLHDRLVAKQLAWRSRSARLPDRPTVPILWTLQPYQRIHHELFYLGVAVNIGLFP